MATRNGPAAARRHEDVHLVPQSRETLGNRRHVHGSAMGGRHRLIDRRIQNSHVYDVVSGFNPTVLFTSRPALPDRLCTLCPA